MIVNDVIHLLSSPLIIRRKDDGSIFVRHAERACGYFSGYRIAGNTVDPLCISP